MLVAHGFPPRECAGTERHTASLCTGLQDLGHQVLVVAATRAPGADQYSLRKENNVVRIVNNIGSRPLAAGESDPIIDRIMAKLEDDFRPDLVHVHHIQFLSSTMSFRAPVVVTLHDEWAWCPAGGLGLRDGKAPCSGPSPASCAPCHTSWRPQPSRVARWLTQAATIASPIVNADRLHRLYRNVPHFLRPAPIRGKNKTESPDAAAHRNRRVRSWFQSADALISPSKYLATKAHTNGLENVEVIPHGLGADWFEMPASHVPRAGFVCIGTVSSHKGTDKIVAGWRAACPEKHPTLDIYGPTLEPSSALGHRVNSSLTPVEVRRALQGAQALLFGSIWPENAPLIIIEARAAGCPVLAPDIGGISEILSHGVDGLLFDPEDPDGLSHCIEDFLSRPQFHPRPPIHFYGCVSKIEAVYHRVIGLNQ